MLKVRCFYLEGDEGCHGKELVGEHEEDHLARDQEHHPEQEKLLPGELSVKPFCQDLDVPRHHLPHLGLHLLGEPLVDDGDLERVELGRGAQAVGVRLRFRSHCYSCHSITRHRIILMSLVFGT